MSDRDPSPASEVLLREPTDETESRDKEVRTIAREVGEMILAEIRKSDPKRDPGPKAPLLRTPIGADGQLRISVEKVSWLITTVGGMYIAWRASGELPSPDLVTQIVSALVGGLLPFIGYRSRLRADQEQIDAKTKKESTV